MPMQTKLNRRKNEAPPPPLVGALSTKDAARYLGVSVISIHRLVQRGFLRPNRVLRYLLFDVDDLNEFIEEGKSQ